MFTIFYLKSSKKITYAYKNDSVGVLIPTPQQQLAVHCDNNNLNVDDFVAIEHPWNRNLILVHGNHIYNEATQQIETDPNYVPPVEPAPVEPTE
jgi:hypothetical protein